MKLKPVKDFLKLILYVDPKIHNELFCSHPYTNSVIVYDGKNFMNLQNENDLQNFHSYILKRIDEIENVNDILSLVEKSYHFYVLKNIHNNMDSKEIGNFLQHCLENAENVRDVLTTTELVKLIKKADITTLMDTDELNKLNSLESNIRVYRGVNSTGVKSKHVHKDAWKSIFWTYDKKVANFFANRYISETNKDKNQRIIYETEIPKEYVLCLFENESQILLDVSKLKLENIKINVLEDKL